MNKINLEDAPEEATHYISTLQYPWIKSEKERWYCYFSGEWYLVKDLNNETEGLEIINDGDNKQ